MKTVIAPIDFSAVSGRVIDAALKLARSIAARVVVLHVAPPPAGIRNVLPAVDDVKMKSASDARAAERKLLELKRLFARRARGVELRHVAGPAARTIVAEAAAAKASYLVLGSHGRSALRDALIGGVAAAVIKTAPCPVLVVPPLGAMNRPKTRA